ncbi:hypothetical protein Ms3S1_23940 [Methylosinus sp. 3S-1]
MTTETILETIDANLPAATERLFDFLRIKSISTDPRHAEDCRHAAQWLCGQLRDLGCDASLRETPGHPVVVGHAKAKRPDAPHVLFYGHYDVQPADPEELWTVDAFQPRLVTGEHGEEIVARGASDDKGQLMTFLEACRAFQANGGLPCHIVFLFEGEEETGSPSLPGFFAANREELRAADLALVCDTSMWNYETPAITTMLRGLAQEEMAISVADRDLHSGMFGGPVRNPIHVVAKIVADLHDAEGRVTLPGAFMTASPSCRRRSPRNGARSNSTRRPFSKGSAFRAPRARPAAASWRRSGRVRPAT